MVEMVRFVGVKVFYFIEEVDEFFKFVGVNG